MQVILLPDHSQKTSAMDLRTYLQNFKAEDMEEMLARVAAYEEVSTSNSSDSMSSDSSAMETCSFKSLEYGNELIDFSDSVSDMADSVVDQVQSEMDQPYEEEPSPSSSDIISLCSSGSEASTNSGPSVVEMIDLTHDESMDEEVQLICEVPSVVIPPSGSRDAYPVYSPISEASDIVEQREETTAMINADDNAMDFPDDSMDEVLQSSQVMKETDKLTAEYALENARAAFPQVQLREANIDEYIEDLSVLIQRDLEAGKTKKIRERWVNEETGEEGVYCCDLMIRIHRQTCPECDEDPWDGFYE